MLSRFTRIPPLEKNALYQCSDLDYSMFFEKVQPACVTAVYLLLA